MPSAPRNGCAPWQTLPSLLCRQLSGATLPTSADLGTDTIADRLVQEVAASGGIAIGSAEIGARSRV
jgi:hypothetical protein